MANLNVRIKGIYGSLTIFGKTGFWLSLITLPVVGIVSDEPFYVVAAMTIGFFVFLPVFFYINEWLWNKIRGKAVPTERMINIAYSWIGVLLIMPFLFGFLAIIAEGWKTLSTVSL